MEQEEILNHFRESGALLDGHFILRSGLRSRQFFQCALALQSMPMVERFGRDLAELARAAGAETVIAPAMGGLVIGQEVARQLGSRFIFAEKVDGNLALRRGFTIRPEEKILIVEDVVTRGGRVAETVKIVEDLGGTVAGVAILVDRSGGQVEWKFPVYSLLAMNVETFSPDDLPEDLQKIPAVKPGS